MRPVPLPRGRLSIPSDRNMYSDDLKNEPDVFNEKIREATQEISEVMARHEDVFADVRAQLDVLRDSGFLDLIKRVAEEQSAFFNSFEKIKAFQMDLGEHFKKIREWQREADEFFLQNEKEKKAFLETGWFFTPSLGEIDVRRVHEAVREYADGNTHAIDELIYSHFEVEGQSELVSCVERWKQNRYFQRWMPAIIQCLKAHQNGEYFLSVPSTLPPIEGIVSDYCRAENVDVSRCSTSGKLKILKAVQNLALTMPGSSASHEYFTGAVENTLYVKSEQADPSSMNRHIVLHGISPDYGEKKKSLQCFMLLDVLSLLS